MSDAVRTRVAQLRNTVIPANIEATLTRDYGQTAAEKTNKLTQKLAFATVSVIILVGLALGRREALIVCAALLPMAFVSGLMGPYMSPIPINSSLGMAISLAIAFTVTPWMALTVMREHPVGGAANGHATSGGPTDRSWLWFSAFLAAC